MTQQRFPLTTRSSVVELMTADALGANEVGRANLDGVDSSLIVCGQCIGPHRPPAREPFRR